MEYEKINTLFKRDTQGLIIPTQYTNSEFYYLAELDWEVTEKIDGTNTRIELSRDSLDQKFKIDFCGRTKNAVMQKNVLDMMVERFKVVDYESIFPKAYSVTIFGEAYGNKVQAVGSRYIKDGNNFSIFDIKVNNIWLRINDVSQIATQINADVVPFIGYMNIKEAIKFVAEGFKSRVSVDKTLNAEGVVLKTPFGLLDRMGHRIITKLKTSDFRKYENKYGHNIDWASINSNQNADS